MDKKIPYVVQVVIPSKKAVPYEHEGVQVTAQIDAVEVHLMPVDEGQGSLNLRLAGGMATQAIESFVQGSTVLMSFEFPADDKKKSEAA